jgi:hypothetical protein
MNYYKISMVLRYNGFVTYLANCSIERMSPLSFLYSSIYTLIIGAIFIYLFIIAYDLLYGEKPEKQTKKIHRHFGTETIKKIDRLEHQPRKYTMYLVTTNNGTKKIKMKPGYKVVNMVSKEKSKKKK